ncbi:phage recombination protein Bet [Oligoflexus tunisiensis]|uniref:phage recombination protein Bet n=1 Tax=Oligoflexus tunisiensis TaxID=708132 RepID=UPI00114CC76D|nr:phage recombination protein Bet [Oligoflexus tunisiensis]
MLPAVSNRDEITPERIAYWTQHYTKDATPEERDHFVGVCRTRGLNPEARHIYFIKVGGRASIVLSIDAYRLIAGRTGAYAGILPALFEFAADHSGKPVKATITVQKFVQGQVREFSATAYFSEFYKTSRDGKKSLWDTMPLTMLEKCAEAKALRKAFPEELSSYYIREEMMEAEVEQPAVLQSSQPAPRQVTDIVVTSDPKVKEWIQKKLQQASVPEDEWTDIIDALNGYPKNELLMQLKKIIADRVSPHAEG